MCGIAGIIRFDGEAVSPEELDHLTDAVAHRGPDSRSVWFNEDRSVAFGHRRLAILDLSEAGKQPMGYHGRYWITLNGEIYNFIELRNELARKGHQFATQTDTEVILAAYKEWGLEMHHRFNGMWAFALYDTVERTLLLSRDRYGVKPLYYYTHGNKMMFSSEVRAIHKILGPAHPLNRPVISDIARGGFFNHGTAQTYLQDVLSLPGGYSVQARNGREEPREWYHLKKMRIPVSFQEQAATLRGLIQDACTLRLRSDVNVGTCLSGGVDSGSITAVINKYDPAKLERSSHYTHRGFCAAFPDTPLDESDSAKRLADSLGSRLDVVEIDAPTESELEEAMQQCDGPMHALAFFPIWSLYRYIKQQGIKVTMDGQGPDEMLGGYRPLTLGLDAAFELRKIRWFFDIYRTYRDQGETPQSSSKIMARKAMKEFLRRKSRQALSSLWDRIRKPPEKPEQTAQCPEAEICDAPLIAVRQPREMTNTFDRGLFHQFFQSPLPGILNQYDRCSMAHGVECRMPFMDYRIVEFVFSLPLESKVGHGYTKRILREAVKGLLPDETRLNKLKIGFNAPIVDWFRGPLREFMLRQMEKKEFLESPYFDGETIRKEFKLFLGSPAPQYNEAWKFWPPVHVAWWIERNTRLR